MCDVHLAGSKLDHFHVCAFVDSRDQEYQVMKDFITEGLKAGEKEIHICDPKLRQDHLDRLRQLGIDVDELQRLGQLEVICWEDAYLKDGKFDSESMLALVDEVVKNSREQGFSRVRLMGHMEWRLEARPGVEQYLEYEEKVTEVLNRCQQPAVCVYDLSKLSGTAAMEILKVHQYAVVGGKLSRNPYFQPPLEA